MRSILETFIHIFFIINNVQFCFPTRLDIELQVGLYPLNFPRAIALLLLKKQNYCTSHSPLFRPHSPKHN